jgi:hypothetical protein
MAEDFSYSGTATFTTSTVTLWSLETASTVRATVIGWWVEFNATSGTPIQVQVYRQATAQGTATAITAANTPRLKDYAPNPLSSIRQAFTVEPAAPTGANLLEIHLIPPSSGFYIQYPLGREPEVAVSNALALRLVTPAAGATCAFGVQWEE